MKTLALSVLSLLAATSAFAYPGDKNVLWCFTHEEMGPSYEYRVYSYAGSDDTYFGEFTNQGATAPYSTTNVSIEKDALSVEVGPGPEAGGREVYYKNGEIIGTASSRVPGFYASTLSIKNVVDQLEMTCTVPTEEQKREPQTR
jgi:hypothetical protein